MIYQATIWTAESAYCKFRTTLVKAPPSRLPYRCDLRGISSASARMSTPFAKSPAQFLAISQKPSSLHATQRAPYDPLGLASLYALHPPQCST